VVALQERAMSETFGRRQPAPYSAPVARPPAPRPEDAPEAKGSWKPHVDPEFEAWDRARAATRWKTWGMCGLIVLGGPMSILMPEGIGQWAGFGLMAVGAAGFLAKFRNPKTPQT
jgi:hypothetical protein